MQSQARLSRYAYSGCSCRISARRCSVHALGGSGIIELGGFPGKHRVSAVAWPTCQIVVVMHPELLHALKGAL